LAETGRVYLELARDYGKKIIVVINQTDLLEKREQQEVRTFVKQQLVELLDLRPQIFTISARQALTERGHGGIFSAVSIDPGGMNAVREYLKETFQRVPPAKQKLYAQLDFVDSIVRKYREQIDQQSSMITNDTALAESLRKELERQAEGLDDQLATAKRDLDRGFEGVAQRGRDFIRENLTIQRASRALNETEMRADFEKQVVDGAINQLTNVSEQYVNAVVDNSRRYWRNILDRLTELETNLSQDPGSVDASGYAEQRAALQEAIAIADRELKSYTDQSLAEDLRNTFRTNLIGFSAGFTAMLGGAIAVALGVAAPGAVTATAGAVIAAVIVGPALLVGGLSAAALYWRKLKRDAITELKTRLDTLRHSYHQAMVDLTHRERTR